MKQEVEHVPTKHSAATDSTSFELGSRAHGRDGSRIYKTKADETRLFDLPFNLEEVFV